MTPPESPKPAEGAKPIALLPCPMCGGEAGYGTKTYHESTVRENGWDQAVFHSVNCIMCGLNNIGIVGHATPVKAAAAWNRRAALATPPTPAVAEGAKPIAREPTVKMLRAANKIGRRNHVEIWQAMWDAAPSPEGVGRSPAWACKHCGGDRDNSRVWACLARYRRGDSEIPCEPVGQEGPSEPEGGG